MKGGLLLGAIFIIMGLLTVIGSAYVVLQVPSVAMAGGMVYIVVAPFFVGIILTAWGFIMVWFGGGRGGRRQSQ